MTDRPKNGHQPLTSSGLPDTQVLMRPTRRSFTADYKRRIIKEADACTRHGELGELLRREELYSSTLAVSASSRTPVALRSPTHKLSGHSVSRKRPYASVTADASLGWKRRTRNCGRSSISKKNYPT